MRTQSFSTKGRSRFSISPEKISFRFDCTARPTIIASTPEVASRLVMVLPSTKATTPSPARL